MRHQILQQSWRRKNQLSGYLWTFGWQQSSSGRFQLGVVGKVGFGTRVRQAQPRVNGGFIKRDMEIRDDRDHGNVVHVHSAMFSHPSHPYSASAIYVIISSSMACNCNGFRLLSTSYQIQDVFSPFCPCYRLSCKPTNGSLYHIVGFRRGFMIDCMRDEGFSPASKRSSRQN